MIVPEGPGERPEGSSSTHRCFERKPRAPTCVRTPSPSGGPAFPPRGGTTGRDHRGCEELPRARGRDERLGTRHAHTHRGTRGTAGATVKSRQRLAASWLLARNPSRTIRINWTQAD